jgi:hypothetical protein
VGGKQKHLLHSASRHVRELDGAAHSVFARAPLRSNQNQNQAALSFFIVSPPLSTHPHPQQDFSRTQPTLLTPNQLSHPTDSPLFLSLLLLRPPTSDATQQARPRRAACGSAACRTWAWSATTAAWTRRRCRRCTPSWTSVGGAYKSNPAHPTGIRTVVQNSCTERLYRTVVQNSCTERLYTHSLKGAWFQPLIL